jgi:hypothetical protein
MSNYFPGTPGSAILHSPKIKKMKNFLLRFAAPLLLLSSFYGCKKSSGGSDSNNNPQYYLTATVAGKAWAANVSNNSLHSACTGMLVKSGSVSVVIALGIQAKSSTDSTAIALIFPSGITLGQQTTFDDKKYSEGAYATMTSGFNTLPANKGSGTITINTFDQSAMVIEGTFTGTFGLASGGTSTVKITDGKFRCNYTTQTNANPFPPNVKF